MARGHAMKHRTELTRGNNRTAAIEQRKPMQPVILNSGVEMPILGFGVFQVPDAIASLDTKQTAFFDHRDPEMVKWIFNAIRNT